MKVSLRLCDGGLLVVDEGWWKKFLKVQTKAFYISVKTNRQRHRYPEKRRAWNAVAEARRSGKLVKPTHCPQCGKETDPLDLHAHHPNGYSKKHRLDVTWLCRACHIEEDFEKHKLTFQGHGKHCRVTTALNKRKSLTIPSTSGVSSVAKRSYT